MCWLREAPLRFFTSWTEILTVCRPTLGHWPMTRRKGSWEGGGSGASPSHPCSSHLTFKPPPVHVLRWYVTRAVQQMFSEQFRLELQFTRRCVQVWKVFEKQLWKRGWVSSWELVDGSEINVHIIVMCQYYWCLLEYLGNVQSYSKVICLEVSSGE